MISEDEKDYENILSCYSHCPPATEDEQLAGTNCTKKITPHQFEERITTFDGWHNRTGVIEVIWGTCDVCKQKDRPVISIDGSEGEYSAGFICKKMCACRFWGLNHIKLITDCDIFLTTIFYGYMTIIYGKRICEWSALIAM